MKPRKLTRRQFARALRQGRGAAFLHVKEYGDKDKGIKEELLNACLNNLVYDTQLEDRRSSWVAEILDRTGNINEYAGPIYSALETALNHTGQPEKRHLEHLINIGTSLFDRGFEDFRPLIIDFCKHPTVKEDPLILASNLIDIAAYFGLELAAKLTDSDRVDDWQRFYLYEYCCNFLDDKFEIDKFLEDKAKTHQSIAAFYKAVREEEEKRKLGEPKPQTAPETYSVNQVIESIEADNPLRAKRMYYRFARQASVEELTLLAEKLNEETDEKRLTCYLGIFSNRELPAATNKIINLLFSPNLELRRAARNALTLVKAPAVRRIALALIKDRKQRDKARGITLLENNFELNDLPLLYETLAQLKQPDLLHSATMTAIDIAKTIDDESMSGLLEWIYGATPCSLCRRRIIELMLQRNIAPLQILHEAQWDASESIENLSRTYLSGRLEN